MSQPKHIISLGGGVQSSTMALMAAAGEIEPMPVAAIFADTQGEPKNVYTWLDWLEKQLPFPVYRVTAGNLEEDTLRVRRSAKSGKLYSNNTIPAYVLQTNGAIGLWGRKCTEDFKITPIQRKFRELLGLKRVLSKEILIIQWIGISTDEADRVKPSKKPWIQSRHPLIEANISRTDCLAWMAAHSYPTPPRSACVFCPFHSDEEWSLLTAEEFRHACAFELSLQRSVAQSEVAKGQPFLHESCVPLGTVTLRRTDKATHKQLSLFSNECEGMCGV